MFENHNDVGAILVIFGVKVQIIYFQTLWKGLSSTPAVFSAFFGFSYLRPFCARKCKWTNAQKNAFFFLQHNLNYIYRVK